LTGIGDPDKLFELLLVLQRTEHSAHWMHQSRMEPVTGLGVYVFAVSEQHHGLPGRLGVKVLLTAAV